MPVQFPAMIELSDLNGKNGFMINGITAYDKSGTAVAPAGDINGDGIVDIIIGASNANPHGTYSGQSYVVFGGCNIGASGVIQLSSLNSLTGFTIDGVASYDNTGFSVAPAGDINSDNITDIIIGAPYHKSLPTEKHPGKSYVIFGSNTIGDIGIFQLSNLNGVNGFKLKGVSDGDSSGYSVASVGDFSGDGIIDLIIGAPGYTNGTGQSYVVFGSSDIGSSGTMQLSELNGMNGFTIDGIITGSYDKSNSGSSVASAGDVNGDGINDIIVGAPYAGSHFNYAGQSYVIFGGQVIGNFSTFQLSSLNGINGFALTLGASQYGSVGNSVASAGDVNDDGVEDLIIGAFTATTDYGKSGKSYIIFGENNIGNSGNINLVRLNGMNGFEVVGKIDENDDFGSSVALAGDFNGDGISDIIIGSPYTTQNVDKPQAGQSYIIFGDKSIGNSGTIEVSDLNGMNGFAINGIAKNDQSGNAVAGAGDVNADGIADIIIGANLASPRGKASGQSYVIFGETIELMASELSLSQGKTITLSSNNFRAVSNYPSATLQFQISVLVHGRFSYISNPEIEILQFYQQNITDGQVQFIHDGSIYPPSFNVSALTGEWGFTPPESTNITFAPLLLTKNIFEINQGQTIVLTSENIFALDSPIISNSEIVFSIQNITHGQFEKISTTKVPITFFSQTDIVNQQIQFATDGSPNMPAYQISVTDGIYTSPYFNSNITFHAPPSVFVQSEKNNSRTILLSTLLPLGALCLLALGYVSSGYLKDYRLNNIAKNKEGAEAQYYHETIIPLAKEVFNRIKITGFMNYISESQMHEYVAAIAKIVHEISEHGINIQLQDMPAEQKTLLVNQIITDMKEILELNTEISRCSTNYFFKPQITPAQLSDNAKTIADAVHTALFSGNTHTAINLPRGVEAWQMGGKSNDKSGERMPLLSA